MIQRKTARQTFEAGLSYIRTEYGWKYLAANGDTIHYHDINILPPGEIDRPPGPTEIHDPVYEKPKHENVTDRIDSLNRALNAIANAQADWTFLAGADGGDALGLALHLHLITKLQDRVEKIEKRDASLQSEVIANMASKIEQLGNSIHVLANRCDGIDRRAKAAAMGINDAQDAIGKLDTSINGGYYNKINGLHSRMDVIQDRFSAIEQTAARIEDMLTEPKAEPTVKDETMPQGCPCQLCRWIRGDCQ